MKILWMSDSPTTASGYGNVTRFICAGLARLGHDVSIIGWQTQTRKAWRGCTIYPVGKNAFGADVILDCLKLIQPDVLVTQGDVWQLSYLANPVVAEFMREARIPWILCCTIDSDMGRGRLPPGFVSFLKTVGLTVVVSRYGLKVARANGVEAAYIPYGVDTEVFRPPRNKVTAKRALGYGDRFVVLCDARNQYRKLLPRCLDIFQRFAADKPDALLHLHCDPIDPAARTSDYFYNLRADIKFLGLADQVKFTAGISIYSGIPLAQLAAIYKAADVHLLTSYGEGFGLPTLQAAATGVVPVASAYSASHELVAGHGELIRVCDFVHDQTGLRCALVDVDDATKKLQRLYLDRTLLRAKSNAARRFAASYDWRYVVQQWHKLLEREVFRLRGSIGRERQQQRTRSIHRHRGRYATKLPDDVRMAIKKLESIGGHLSAGIILDLARSKGSFTLPVTLPAVNGLAAKGRVPGRVYLASASDLAAFSKLKRIFPGLSAWSSAGLKSDRESSQRLSRMTAVGRFQHQRYLSASVLALDSGGVDSKLPALAAKLGVLSIGLRRCSKQAWLWPSLSVDTANSMEIARLARLVLTDRAEAIRACALARKRIKTSAEWSHGPQRNPRLREQPAA